MSLVQDSINRIKEDSEQFSRALDSAAKKTGVLNVKYEKIENSVEQTKNDLEKINDESKKQSDTSDLEARHKKIESYILSYPNENKKTPTKNYQDRVYFVKKEARYQDEKYYLLSTERSSIEGVIGWMESKYLTIHNHILVDTDKKNYSLTGEGVAYSKPWGGKKELVFKNLKKYKDQNVLVTCTEYVGKNLWHQTEIENQSVWINNKFIKKNEFNCIL